MQALILAGGLGTRLGDITRTIPKPMVQVGDKPFLEWLVVYLRENGINCFVFSVGYLAEQIQDHFGDGGRFGCRIEYSVEEELLGTGGAVKKADGLLEDVFFVVNGDNLLRLDYAGFFACRKRYGAAGLVSCWPNRPRLFQSNVDLDLETGRIVDYDYHDEAGKNHVDCGVKVFSREVFSFFDQREAFSLEIDVLPRLVRAGSLYGFPVAEPPLDIGTLDGLKKTRREIDDLKKI